MCNNGWCVYSSLERRLVAMWMPFLIIILMLLAPDVAEATTKLDCNEAKSPGLSIRECSSLIRLNPRNQSAYFFRGNAFLAKGDFDGAIADYTSVLEINPTSAPAYHNRGLAHRLKRNKCEQYRPLSTKELQRGAKQLFALSPCETDLSLAIADFSKAIEINQNLPFSFEQRGEAYYFLRDFDRAISDYNSALKLNPQFALAFERRGDALRMKGNPDQR